MVGTVRHRGAAVQERAASSLDVVPAAQPIERAAVASRSAEPARPVSKASRGPHTRTARAADPGAGRAARGRPNTIDQPPGPHGGQDRAGLSRADRSCQAGQSKSPVLGTPVRARFASQVPGDRASVWPATRGPSPGHPRSRVESMPAPRGAKRTWNSRPPLGSFQ